MLTAKSALHWEMRRALFPAVLITLSLFLFFGSLPATPNFMMRLRGMDVEAPELSLLVQFPLIILSLTISLFVIGQAVGMSQRQYALPITSRTLATIRLIPGAFCCAALYLIASTLLNLTFRSGWPMYSPALTSGVSFMVVYAAVALFRGNEVRVGLAGLNVAVLLIFWIGGHYGSRWWIKLDHGWPDLSATELVFLAAVAFASWCSLVTTLERDRRGAGWGRIIHSTASAVPTLRVQRKPARQFFSSVTALFWQEWRQDGWLVFFVVVGIQLAAATIHTFSTFSSQRYTIHRFDHEYEFHSMIFGFLPACAILPWFLGLTGEHGRRALNRRTWPTSQSTLPLSDTALGWIYFARVVASSLVAAIGVLVVTGLWFAATELIALSFGEVPANRVPQIISKLNPFGAFAYVALLTLTLWLTAGLSSAATLTGRPWIGGIPLLLIAGWFVFFVGTLLYWNWGPRPYDPFEQFRILFVFAQSLCVMGMVLAYIFGMSYDVVRPTSAVFGLIVTILSISFFVFLRSGVGPSNRPLEVADMQFLLLFMLAGAPPALIPLATYYNRHR